MVEQMVDINLYSYSGRCDTVRDLLYVLFIFSYGKDLKKHPHIKFDMLLRLSNIITVSKLCRRLDMADHARISYVSKTSDTL